MPSTSTSLAPGSDGAIRRKESVSKRNKSPGARLNPRPCAQTCSDLAAGVELVMELRIMRSREYRREAVEAQSMAMQANRTAEKAAWLCVAQGWMSLLRQRTSNAGTGMAEAHVPAHQGSGRRHKKAQKGRSKVRRLNAHRGAASAAAR